MKKTLVDVNVILDVLLDRQPHARASGAVWAAIESGLSQGLLAAHAVTTIHYLIRRELGAAKATHAIARILRIFGVAMVDGAVIQQALGLSMPDFEDSVTAAAAQLTGCDFIVTRDPKGFRGSPVRSFAPEAAVPLLKH
jgi:predicted nucleic acid-binding protein